MKPHAKYLGKMPGGQKVYRFPVKVLLNDSRNHHRWLYPVEEWHQVHATNAAEAANYIRELYRFRAETEVFAYGTKGGETYRYIGYDSAIFAGMMEAADSRRQPNLL